jgi:acyl-coenzyme A thioesterase PaaI-like protein
MSRMLDLYTHQGPAKFAADLDQSGRLFTLGTPPHIVLTASDVCASYQVDDRYMKSGRVPDGALAVMANDIATLAIAASMPVGASWSKTALRIEFLAATGRGEIRVRSVGEPINWGQAAEQEVAVVGEIGNGSPVFKATMTVNIVPAP